jgi:ankyrin repeat protein
VSYLLSTGIEPSKKSYQRHTPLHYAACFGQLNVLSILLDAGADVNEVDHDGWAPLHHAAHQGHAEAVALLLARNATVDLKNQIFCTPLHVACMAGHKQCIAQLLTAGAEHEYDPPYVNPVDSMNRPPTPTTFDEGVIFQRSTMGEALLGLLQSSEASDEVHFCPSVFV